MIMGVERKWAPTMLKLEGGAPTNSNSVGATNGNAVGNNDAGEDDEGGEQQQAQQQQQQQQSSSPGLNSFPASQQQHFFLEILRTKHGVWHMWVWYLGEAAEAALFRCDIAIRKRGKGGADGGGNNGDLELKYSGRVHSIRVPPHRVILSGCLLSFSDYTAAQFRYLGEGHQGHPVIDYRFVRHIIVC